MSRLRTPARATAGVLGALLVVGCTQAAPVPPPPEQTAAERPFTVVTAERPRTHDPAAAVTDADAIVAINVFSRLMVVHPDGAELKPDLATDCLFTSATTYRCEIPAGLTFHNGHELTADDVKFSIERAYRLSVRASSARLLDALERVEVVDPQTVDFELKWADTQFGYALATPAAGIVDAELYDPDAVRPNEGQAIGSGPYQLVTTADDHLVFEKFAGYRGALSGGMDAITLRFVADSAEAEAMMAGDEPPDVVWRSLGRAARERLAEAARRTPASDDGSTYTSLALPESRMVRLMFNPASVWRGDELIRGVLASALQPDRSTASLVPPGVPGSSPSFAVGGNPEVSAIPGQRLRLTLGYASSAPDLRDTAGLLRDRLEARGGLSVQLVPDAMDADLILVDAAAWVNTAHGWLQAYTDDPLPESAATVQRLVRTSRETTDAAERAVLLAELQAQAAADLTVLPVSVGSETIYLGKGVSLQGRPYGPGWQLGFWSMRR